MPSERVAFRAVPPLDLELAARAAGPESTLGATAQTELSRWFRFLAAHLSRVRLTSGQALYLCDILNATITDDDWWLRNPGELLAAEVIDAVEDGIAEKYGIDAGELAALCRSWNPAEALAVIDAVRRWWYTTTPDDFEERLTAVGLLRAPRRAAL